MLDRETENYLFTLRRRGIKIGLHRTETLLAKCGNPHYNIPVIHIAGTNGKGSTAAMIASILRESGRKVGLYTSPHLIRFNERIRVNGKPITDDQITKFLNRYRSDIDSLSSTFFEATTALTFSYFYHSDIDIAVIEVGLGGRLDSTNVSKSVLSVITPIDYDHMEFLGHNLKSIAKEKFGIIKPQTSVVSSLQHPEVMDILEETVKKYKSDLNISVISTPIENSICTNNGSTFYIHGQKYYLPLLGKHQINNAQTAITACKVYDWQIETQSIKEGLAKVSWPGRMQKLSENPIVFYDVAHNPHGLQAVLESTRELYPGFNIACICALKKTKSIKNIVELVKKYCKNIITTMPNQGDFFTPRALWKEFKKQDINAQFSETVVDALSFCTHIEENRRYVWLIFGTHYFAEDIFTYFNFSFDNGEI
ncbi:MAG: bifunctional folylpolyglutamate synthase/dihydrofolate synthase [Candidatus Marinimicrobia bacterium]|nr:bifunctional folylpolyglutamate synthase/dihydrofolate synthase [Candidatus Neomarinimicrobiota bacterium]